MKKLVVIGDPITHSLSPVIHNAALKALELEKKFHYEKMRVTRENLAQFIQSMKNGVIAGASVTLPLKEVIVNCVDRVTMEARLIGAVNTLYREHEKIVGHNTDGIGFLASLEENIVRVSHEKIVILGAGGSARAIAFSISSQDPRDLVILNRTAEKARKLSKEIKEKTGKEARTGGLEKIEEELKDANILIHCTSVGMRGSLESRSLVASKMLSPRTVVVDIVYIPPKSLLLKKAEGVGCETINGIGMLVHQAAAAFALWTGKSPPLETMRAALASSMKVRS